MDMKKRITVKSCEKKESGWIEVQDENGSRYGINPDKDFGIIDYGKSYMVYYTEKKKGRYVNRYVNNLVEIDGEIDDVIRNTGNVVTRGVQEPVPEPINIPVEKKEFPTDKDVMMARMNALNNAVAMTTAIYDIKKDSYLSNTTEEVGRFMEADIRKNYDTFCKVYEVDGNWIPF